ncbi:hypothetical protein PMAYCL1PPCAC_17324 [Pristionchus mayeri]|uniref:Uncharacterized protein n=1 Tax=Pristionchus mayeri TaxID=1317129 RepID=A0AAN5I0A0_9BILA|nr:hypothetical protein PMAYCL1PPCAC_17324 [Pristionchus mayeri]
MSECLGVQIATCIFAAISFLFSIGFSIGAFFIPVVDEEEWDKITIWALGGVNAACALLVFFVLFESILWIRWVLLPKIVIGIVNIAFFAFLLTLSTMTLCGTKTMIDEQIQHYYDNNEKFRNWIADSYPGEDLSRFSKEVGIFGVVINVLLLCYSAVASYITLLYFMKLGKQRESTASIIDESVKIVPFVASTYDHSTLTGGYGPLEIRHPVILVKDGPPVFGTSPPPYVD